MILNFFAFLLVVFSGVIENVGSAFSSPVFINNTITIIIEKMMLFNQIIPVSDILIGLITLLSFEIVLFIIKTILSIVNWFRGAGGISLDI